MQSLAWMRCALAVCGFSSVAVVCLAAGAPVASAAVAATPSQFSGKAVTETFAQVGLPLVRARLKPTSIKYYVLLPNGSGPERVRVAVLTSEGAARKWAASWTRYIRDGRVMSTDPNGLTRVHNVIVFVFSWTSTSDRRAVARAIRALNAHG
jgi:hypothetical protein